MDRIWLRHLAGCVTACLAATALHCGTETLDDCVEMVQTDIVPFVRLAASDTVHEIFPWPIEAVDVAATVRDENPDTSWKIPASAPPANGTVLTLDIQPWLGRQIPLKTASMTFTGDLQTVTLSLSEGCGGPVTRTIEWPSPFDTLDLGGTAAGCVQIKFGNAENAALDSLSILADVPACAVETGGWSAPEPQSVTAPESGLIEGFYGIPWSWTERKRLISEMAATGLGSYLYCPKWDAKHRAQWREPYSETEMASFGEVIDHANSLDVSFSFGISPFIDYDASDGDYETLRDKIAPFLRAGARSFTLLADDIEFDTASPVDAVMGAVHADVANRLLDDLRAEFPGTTMAFVPTVYSDDRLASFPEGEAYLQELAALGPEIAIMWTGTGTSASTMTAADMGEFTRITGRKPLIWDNFWANDGGDGFVGRILLGPFTGRTPDLPDAVLGIMHNPGIQGALTRLDVTTFAAWTASPDDWDPVDATGYAARLEAAACGEEYAIGVPATAALLFMMQLFEGNARQMPGHQALMAQADALRADISGGSGDPAAGVGAMLFTLGRMATAESEVWHSGIAADMHDELVFPLQKIRYEGEAGLAILDAIVERSSGRDGEAAIDLADEAFYLSNSCRFTFGEQKLEKLLYVVKGMALSGSTFERVEIASPESGCVTGQPLSWEAIPDGLDDEDLVTEVSGLPEAVIQNGIVTWTPPQSGIYRGAITVFRQGSPALFGYRILELACVAGDHDPEE